MSSNAARRTTGSLAALAALGVVFGDIGTSPLYALGTVFAGSGGTDREVVLGVASMVVWSITLVVTVLYVRILLRFDNDGEGGLLALLALLRQGRPGRRVATAATVLAIVGAAMFLGDSMITPAISVLSAVEGVTVVTPDLQSIVVPVTVVVLGLLFLAQRLGTSRIGAAFGPVMLCWFVAAGVFGAVSLARAPQAVQALSPHWIVVLVAHRPWTAFVALGGVVLAITGAEALFADLGHFGRRPITVAWLAVVFPALVLSYLGQAAAVLTDPAAAGNPFYAAVPHWARVPMVVLATAATVIASQSVIAGAFSVVQQAGRLELLPLPRVVHTSGSTRGQVYLPVVNGLLGAAVLALVLGFGSSGGLAAAYGIAVTLAICTTASLLLLLLATRRSLVSLRGLVVGVALLVVLVFVAANLLKVGSGGWVPLSAAAALIVVMWTWQRGRGFVDRARAAGEPPLSEVAAVVRGTTRVAGCAVYLTEAGRVPSALVAAVERNHVLPDEVVVVIVDTTDLPYGVDATVSAAEVGLTIVRARFGYRERVRIVDALDNAADLAVVGPGRAALADATFVLSSNTPVADPDSTLPRWQQRLFLTLDHVDWPPERMFELPAQRTIVVGRELPI